MNLLETLNSVDEQEVELNYLTARQRVKKLISDKTGARLETYLLDTIADLHLLLLSLRTQEHRQETKTHKPVSLRVSCPFCREGVLLLEDRVNNSAVVCSDCMDYEVEL